MKTVAGFEHLEEEMHVLIEASGSEAEANAKLQYAKQIILEIIPPEVCKVTTQDFPFILTLLTCHCFLNTFYSHYVIHFHPFNMWFICQLHTETNGSVTVCLSIS
jgi:hypothetical protein